MSRSTKASTIKRLLTVLAIGGGGVLGLIYVQAFAKIDPLLNMRKGNVKEPSELGIRLGDVHLVQYDGMQKIAEADVEHVFVTDDRRQYRLGGVSNGSYYSKEGKQLRFSAPKAIWNSTYKLLTANDGVRVWNADMNLKTATFRIDGIRQTLYAPGSVEGLFYKGQIQSKNLLYSMKNEEARFGPTHWDGNMALSLQDGDKPQAKRWSFDNSNGTLSQRKGIQTFTNTTATDGEIIVKADKIERDTKTDIVTATGHVQYFSPESNMSCEKVVVYRSEKRAILSDTVNMLVKPKAKQTKAEIVEIPPFRPMVPKDIAEHRPDAPPPQKTSQDKKLDQDLQDPKTIRDYPMAIKADKIEYWYGKGKRHAIITGDPQARQELPGGRWRHVWAFQAFYDGEKELLRMVSKAGGTDVKYQSSNDDDTMAKEVTVSTEEGNDDLEAIGTTGKVYGTADEDNDAGPKPPDPIKPGSKGKGKGGAPLQGPIGGKKLLTQRLESRFGHDLLSWIRPPSIKS